MQDFVDAFRFIGDHHSLILHLTLVQIRLAAVSIAAAIVLGLPLGVWLGHLHRGSFIAINLGNLLRALPSLAVIAIGLTFFGIGYTNTTFALFVVGFPVILTNAYVGVAEVDRDAVDAARGMGMSGWNVLTRVELPLALPLIFAGIRTAAVFIVATAPLGAVAGSGGGLGDIIVNQASYRFSGVLGAAICVAVLALLTQFAFTVAQRLATPRGLRVAGRVPSVFGIARRVPVAADATAEA
jgi:osmoprotectant transport system permease protein